MKSWLIAWFCHCPLLHSCVIITAAVIHCSWVSFLSIWCPFLPTTAVVHCNTSNFCKSRIIISTNILEQIICTHEKESQKGGTCRRKNESSTLWHQIQRRQKCGQIVWEIVKKIFVTVRRANLEVCSKFSWVCQKAWKCLSPSFVSLLRNVNQFIIYTSN